MKAKWKMKLGADQGQLKIFYLLSIILLIVDQLTKLWAQQTLKNQPPRIFLGDFFRFDYAENPGAFLGMGDSLSDPIRFWIFIIFVFILMIGLAAYIHMKSVPRIEVWAYAFVFAGGVGNLIDRTFRANGRVIDFMNMDLFLFRTGIFNVADMAIMAGLALLIWPSISDFLSKFKTGHNKGRGRA